MKPIALLASLVIALTVTACKKKEGAGDNADTAAKTGTAAAARLEPFTGALTIDRVLGAKELVKPFDAWDEAQPKLEHQLGKPTKVDGAKHQWAAMDGDDCAYLVVEQDEQAGAKTVGLVQSPMKVAKDGPVINYRDCLAILGKSTGPAEDPAAPAPPADGAPVAAAEFRDVAVKARSKWKDQKVSITGVYGNATTATSGDQKFVTVSLKAAKDDTGAAIKCALPTNAEAPAGLERDQPVVASGTVEIQEWTSMSGGEPRLEASLGECTIAPAPAK